MKNILRGIQLLLLVFAFSASAQQLPNYTLYKYNLNIINPAYAGSTGFNQLSAHFRSQWSGIHRWFKFEQMSCS